MKTGLTFIFALFLLCESHILSAQTLFTWTDEAGVVHITDSKPPEGVMVQNVIQYKEKTYGEIREYKRLQEKKRQDRLKQEKIQETQKAKNEAKKLKPVPKKPPRTLMNILTNTLREKRKKEKHIDPELESSLKRLKRLKPWQYKR